MEDKVDTNGPEWRRNPWPPFAKEEMTLRDYFAAKLVLEFVGFATPEQGAQSAYRWADAMLKARK